MERKLSTALCYLAGLQNKGREARNAVGISTKLESITQRFVEISINDLGIKPNRIIIEEKTGSQHVFFYHSRIWKRLHEISENAEKIFKYKNELAAAYVAGMFDAAGHRDRFGLYIKGAGPRDAVLLQNLGIYTRENRIMNVSSFVSLIKGQSLLLDTLRVAGK